MNEAFQYLDIIILAILAGVVLLRLRSVLGRRTGHEKTDQSTFQYEQPSKELNPKVEIESPTVDRTSINDDSWFNENDFVNGANNAYEVIITNFENGNKDLLKPLLNEKVMKNFFDVIDKRNANNEKVEFSFIGIESSKIIYKNLKNNPMEVTIKFVSEMITCIKNNKDEIISGSINQVQKITDVWTFSKNKTIKSNNWLLSATSD